MWYNTLMDTTTLLGASGSLLILIAFTLNQIHTWDDQDLDFDMANLIGSFLLTIYSIALSSLPFLVLNLVWFLVSARDVINHFTRKKKKRWIKKIFKLK